MSQIDTRKTSTAGDTQSKGCGCGGHDNHSKDKAARPAPADAGRKPADTTHGHADSPKRGAGCCGGHKAHK